MQRPASLLAPSLLRCSRSGGAPSRAKAYSQLRALLDLGFLQACAAGAGRRSTTSRWRRTAGQRRAAKRCANPGPALTCSPRKRRGLADCAGRFARRNRSPGAAARPPRRHPDRWRPGTTGAAASSPRSPAAPAAHGAVHGWPARQAAGRGCTRWLGASPPPSPRARDRCACARPPSVCACRAWPAMAAGYCRCRLRVTRRRWKRHRYRLSAAPALARRGAARGPARSTHGAGSENENGKTGGKAGGKAGCDLAGDPGRKAARRRLAEQSSLGPTTPPVPRARPGMDTTRRWRCRPPAGEVGLAGGSAELDRRVARRTDTRDLSTGRRWCSNGAPAQCQRTRSSLRQRDRLRDLPGGVRSRLNAGVRAARRTVGNRRDVAALCARRLRSAALPARACARRRQSSSARPVASAPAGRRRGAGA